MSVTTTEDRLAARAAVAWARAAGESPTEEELRAAGTAGQLPPGEAPPRRGGAEVHDQSPAGD